MNIQEKYRKKRENFDASLSSLSRRDVVVYNTKAWKFNDPNNRTELCPKLRCRNEVETKNFGP